MEGLVILDCCFIFLFKKSLGINLNVIFTNLSPIGAKFGHHARISNLAISFTFQSLLRGYTKATIMPMHHRRARPAHVAKSWPLTPLQVVHNKPDVMLRV